MTFVAKKQQQDFYFLPIRERPERPGVAWAVGLWPFKSIVVGRDWFFLPEGEQQAALLHEVGHCRGFHMEWRWLLLPLCWLPAVQRLARAQELEADAFAVREGRGVELLHLIFRGRRPAAGSVEARLCPSPQERAQNILRLLQEHRNEKLAA